VDAVAGDAEPLLTGEEGREILRMSFAIYDAARKRRDVYLEELDLPFPGFYAWRQRRREKKESFIESFRKPLLGRNLSKYAPRAKELTERFVERFDAEAADDWESLVGLRLTPDGGVREQTFTLRVSAGQVALKEEPIPGDVKLTIAIPAGTWAAIVLGKKSLESALFGRQLKVDGEAREGLRLRGAFHI
jgi:hypothetical protein